MVGSARGSTVWVSSVDAAPAGSGPSDEGEDVFLLDDYDLEGQSRGQDVEDTREKVRAGSSRKTSFASRLLLWWCAHMQCDARPWSKGAHFCRVVKRPFWILVAILGLVSLVSFAWDSVLSVLADSRDAGIFPGQRPSLFSDWLTHGVVPIPCHSHNDYWRRVPLFSALAVGCTSVEADIWLDGDELRVGHTMRTVLPDQSLRSLYIDPLLEILEQHNAPRNFSTSDTASSADAEIDEPAPVGVFATDPGQTLILLIDFKEFPDLLWPVLMNNLQPLRQRGYLTHFNGTDIINRPITVVATGDAPFDRIQDNTSYRDIFYDAPLDKLPTDTPSTSDPEAASPYTKYNSYYASVDFHASIGSLYLGRLSADQLTKVRAQIAAAHDRGLKVRYWGTPGWPVGLRNYVWRVLVREGVDMLNVDDLRGASRVDWRVKGWWGRE